MDYIEILFLFAGISIITIFIVYYSYISKQLNEYIIPYISSSKNNDIYVNEIKLTMSKLDESLDEYPNQLEEVATQHPSVLQIPYDFIKRNIMYYGKPILHNSIDPFL
jgi:hypothetical protein